MVGTTLYVLRARMPQRKTGQGHRWCRHKHRRYDGQRYCRHASDFSHGSPHFWVRDSGPAKKVGICLEFRPTPFYLGSRAR